LRKNTFRDTAGVAFTLIQTNIKMSNLAIRDCVFVNQQSAPAALRIQGTIDNVTFNGSLKEDVSLTNGVLDVHNTPVNVDKLVPVGAPRSTCTSMSRSTCRGRGR